MRNHKNRKAKRFINQFNFDEIDHRLACGWHAEVNESSHKKKYLSEIKHSAINQGSNFLTKSNPSKNT